MRSTLILMKALINLIAKTTQEYQEAVTVLENRDDIQGLITTSGKSVFIAGLRILLSLT